ncbi:competence type IV pilus assembly protein ComGB [Neobacillus sp. DY30]|uniref:competence type IV pilus assembly protein ComGB n=1 Tax=Neobacillus sp. DY30 TaxID=3047871 RepID=UPI0024C06CBC|nr:competence type IV pilus assembly protein ComGB [Neobacillus sp. DY30]WHX99296.1 competence type IV pilus assembly protein ComGB [Neobacillus sp. DY30]
MKRTKWSINEQALLLKRIGELLARGYPIAEAIESLSLHLPKNRKEELYQCLIDLRNGVSFHDVLDKLRFHKDLIGYVYFAEQHGSFAEALLEGSNLALVKEKDRNKLLKLLQYPALLFSITGILFLFVQQSLLPKFTGIFSSMGLEANFFMKVLYSFDEYFPFVMLVFLTLLALGAIYYVFVFRKTSVLQQRSQLVKIPIAGRILRLLFTHYFAVQLSFLLAGGISVLEALLLFEKNNSQPFYSRLGSDIKQKLLTGEKLESILSSFPFFEREFPMIIKHGQENGKLEQELLLFSQHCVVNMEERIEKSLKMIQPVLYLFIGFLVVSMYLAILLPMFQLLDGI